MLEYYERELQYLRGGGAEFAQAYPRIAGRLGLTSTDCSDPYVERLLEGTAFLSARVQLKLDAEFPTLTQSLLESICPGYLAPTPSMCVVRFEPDMADGSLAEGIVIPRGTSLRGHIGPDEQTACQYTTAHEVALWPLRIVSASFTAMGKAEARIRFEIESPADIPLRELALAALPVYFTNDAGRRVFEACCLRARRVLYASPGGSWSVDPGPEAIYPMGFDDDHALLPVGPRSFSGYRMLHEYFALPERYRLIRFDGLAEAMARCDGRRLEVSVEVSRPPGAGDVDLERTFSPEDLQLFCTPAVNLFERPAGRLQLDETRREYHIVIDRTRPRDFEVHSVESVTGYDENNRAVQGFFPLFGARGGGAGHGCYTLRREGRAVSARERRIGSRTSYQGGEIYLSVSDPESPPVNPIVRTLGLRVLATNRDLPITMPVGVRATDFDPEDSYPIVAARIIAGPTAPAASPVVGELNWRLISHLTLNYLSLLDERDKGATALRGLLSLYAHATPPALRHQIDGLRSVEAIPMIGRAPRQGPIAFIRGLDIRLDFEDARFEGSSPFLLAAVLERFFPRYVSINSFTRTRFHSEGEGEVSPWPLRPGRREVL